MTPNRKAILDTISWSEGTSTSVATRLNGYDVIVTGADEKPEVFADFRAHPFAGGRKPKLINSRGLVSTASGRYQNLVTDWPHYRDLLRLPDFGPMSQDAWAIQLIAECHALPLIDAGQFGAAVAAIAHLWASLPGANYEGQGMHTLASLQAQYVAAGGVVA